MSKRQYFPTLGIFSNPKIVFASLLGTYAVFCLLIPITSFSEQYETFVLYISVPYALVFRVYVYEALYRPYIEDDMFYFQSRLPFFILFNPRKRSCIPVGSIDAFIYTPRSSVPFLSSKIMPGYTVREKHTGKVFRFYPTFSTWIKERLIVEELAEKFGVQIEEV